MCHEKGQKTFPAGTGTVQVYISWIRLQVLEIIFTRQEPMFLVTVHRFLLVADRPLLGGGDGSFALPRFLALFPPSWNKFVSYTHTEIPEVPASTQ